MKYCLALMVTIVSGFSFGQYRNDDASGALTTGVEKKDISIPPFIDITSNSQWNGLRHDSESGWTRCRVPLKGELSWQGIKDRDLVFECKPLTYF